MERKTYQRFLEWKRRGCKKPLMVVGARQIGKTYLIDEFAKREFKRVLAFNLTARKDIVELFSRRINTQEKVDQLEFLIGQAIDFENTLLFFDEVQESEELIEAMKFFAEADRHYNIICAGSLLGVKLRRFGRSFPVGKVEFISMYPMDFEEYLWACDERLLSEHIRECFNKDQEMFSPLHERALKLYRQYLCVGGMPEALSDLIASENQVLSFNRSILDNIQQSYISDMAKYVISPQEAARIEAAYYSLASQLGNTSHKFQYAKVKKGAKRRDFETSLNWLVASRMVYECKAVTSAQPPLNSSIDPDTFKLFLNDSGLLVNLLDVRFPDIMLDVAFPGKGIIAENYVAAQMAAHAVPLRYWRDSSNAEVDFLIDTPDGIIPLEVKSGTNKGSPSLRRYMDAFCPAWAVRVTAKNFGFVKGIKSVPLYATFCLSDLIAPHEGHRKRKVHG
jgi:predicted AAA+ superfamily ATPase